MSNIDAKKIEAIADTIMHNFIPKDSSAQDFSFHFTLPPAQNFLVKYKKDKNGQWNFQGFEAITSHP